MGMTAGNRRAKISAWLLFSDPVQKRLKLGSLTKQIQTIIRTSEIGIGISRVKLLVAGLAERRAMFGFSTFLLGPQVMQRDQPRRYFPVTQGTSDELSLWIKHVMRIVRPSLP
jgi:hypothetical protein